MSDTEAITLVCMRQADLPTTRVHSVEGRCMDCAEPVWVSLTSDAELMRRPGSAIICQVCILARMATDPDLQLGVLPSTAAEVAQLAAEEGWTGG